MSSLSQHIPILISCIRFREDLLANRADSLSVTKNMVLQTRYLNPNCFCPNSIQCTSSLHVVSLVKTLSFFGLGFVCAHFRCWVFNTFDLSTLFLGSRKGLNGSNFSLDRKFTTDVLEVYDKLALQMMS